VAQSPPILPTPPNTGQCGAAKVTRNLKTVPRFAEASPFTEAQVRWWIFNERHNGMAEHGVVVRIGRRVYLDAAAFDRWVDAQQEVRGAAA
jgi:hypothetical protein